VPPADQSFDWRGFAFFSKFSIALIVLGVGLHYGTLYAAAMLIPEPTMQGAVLMADRAAHVPPNPKDLSWSEALEHAPWAPRDSAASFVFKNRMWIVGGLNGNGVKAGPEHAVEYWTAPYFNDIWSSDDGEHWQNEGTAPWPPRRSMAVVEFNKKLWMLGGWTPKVGYTSDVWVSDDGVHWSQALEHAPWPAREGHTLNVWQGKLWLIGGVNYDARKTYNDVWYSSDGITWLQAPDAPWDSRWDHASAELGGNLVMTGGMDLNKNTFADVWSTSDGMHWTQVLAQAPWMSRQGHQLLVSGGVMYSLGRLNDDTTTGPNDIWYTRDGAAWYKTADDPPWIGREDHGALLFNDRLWVLGGMDVNWHWQNDAWRSSPLSFMPAASKPEPALSAKSSLLIELSNNGTQTTLYSHDTDAELPIASMTKLMTALVASETYSQTDTVSLKGALAGKGLSGMYVQTDIFFIKDALYALLVASHNEIANALAQKMGTPAFVAAMNERARVLGMTHTRFVNPSGLDESVGESNHSSANDIAILLNYIYKNKTELFGVLSTKDYALKDASGKYITNLKTTDKLLTSGEVLGGKTGETPKALQNLAFVARHGDTVLIGVVVGSGDSAADAHALIEYATAP
jgi:hypothetical protein